MKYDPEDHELVVDCEAELPEPSAYLEFPETRRIRWDDCAAALELPQELNQLSKLEAISVYGRSRKDAYPAPRNLAGFPGLKSLTLWSFCDFTGLPSLPNIERLAVVVREPLADLRILVDRFPNLKQLDLWGSHLKSGQLPPEIGDLSGLEHLELVSCGLTELPPEFARLQGLRKLCLRGLPMTVFPEAICELGGLVELQFRQSVVKLPESFAKLGSLRKLDFASAFNKGTMSPVNRWSDQKVYLHPIPEEIGLLPALEDLDLSMCGLQDPGFLKNAGQLKRLRSQYSALKDCEAFTAFTALEELDLESGEVLENINGLAGLPIVRLKLEDCDELSDLSPILELPRLKFLNIEGCDDIENLNPVYEHPSLEVLEASEEVLEQWQRREELANLRPIESVVADIESAAGGSGDAQALNLFEAAVADLKSHVDRNYHDENNPLAGYFGAEPDNYEIVELPALEAAFEAHREQLSRETLVTLAQISLRSVTNDNYEITLRAAREINRRQDTEAQTELVRIFKAACEYYDFGHRFMESTVLDQLYDDVFPEFATSALLELLRDAHCDMLNSDGGDQADLLFAPAFQSFQNEDEFSELLHSFFEYQDESVEYHGAEYFGELHSDIRAALSGDKLSRFEEEVRKRGEQLAVLQLIESEESADKVRLIALLPELDDEFLRSNAYKILRPLEYKVDVPKEVVLQAVDFFIRREEDSSDVADLINKLILPEGFVAVVDYLKKYAQDADEARRDYLADLTKSIIRSAIIAGKADEEIQPLRDFLLAGAGLTATAIRGYELRMIFKLLEDSERHIATNTPEKLEALLLRMDRTAGVVAASGERIDIRGWDFMFDIHLLASHADEQGWHIIKRICSAFFPVIAPRTAERALYISIIAAGKTHDLEHFERMLAYVPKKINEELLAYNLACVCATFEKKEAMLKYIRRSIALGKTVEQFEDDPDFAPYRGDEDFRRALSGG